MYKTGSAQPKLSAACFVVQSCLADADFVVFSNYCLIGTQLNAAFVLLPGSVLFPLRRLENPGVRWMSVRLRNESSSAECEKEGRWPVQALPTVPDSKTAHSLLHG